MAYQDIGYDEFLNRVNVAAPQNNGQTLNPQQFDSLIDQISGSKIQNGIIKSSNGAITIDLDNEILLVTNGVVDLLRAGKLDDESFGIEIKNINGDIINSSKNNPAFAMRVVDKLVGGVTASNQLTFVGATLVPISYFTTPIDMAHDGFVDVLITGFGYASTSEGRLYIVIDGVTQPEAVYLQSGTRTSFSLSRKYALTKGLHEVKIIGKAAGVSNAQIETIRLNITIYD